MNTRSNTVTRTDCVSASHLHTMTIRRCSLALWAKLHVSKVILSRYKIIVLLNLTPCPLLHVVVPLNIGMLNLFGRKISLTVLQLLAGIFFMLLNICTTM